MKSFQIGSMKVDVDYDESVKGKCYIQVWDGDADGYAFTATKEQVKTLGEALIAFTNTL